MPDDDFDMIENTTQFLQLAATTTMYAATSVLASIRGRFGG